MQGRDVFPVLGLGLRHGSPGCIGAPYVALFARGGQKQPGEPRLGHELHRAGLAQRFQGRLACGDAVRVYVKPVGRGGEQQWNTPGGGAVAPDEVCARNLTCEVLGRPKHGLAFKPLKVAGVDAGKGAGRRRSRRMPVVCAGCSSLGHACGKHARKGKGPGCQHKAEKPRGQPQAGLESAKKTLCGHGGAVSSLPLLPRPWLCSKVRLFHPGSRLQNRGPAPGRSLPCGRTV